MGNRIINQDDKLMREAEDDIREDRIYSQDQLKTLIKNWTDL